MNYRHAFHAGNFADVIKHAALTQCLEAMTRDPAPLTVIDTHAGAGAYDLAGVEASKSGEAERGIARLMDAPDAPEAFDILIAAVSRINEGGAVRRYPGSPMLTLAALRPQDRLIACEIAPAEHAHLRELIEPGADARKQDGFAVAMSETPAKTQVLIHIDPPFERAEDYARAVEATAAVLGRNPRAVVIIWLPLKDLETFDAFLRRMEARISAPTLVAETRLRPLDDPMRLNGCALIVVNAPEALAPALAEICSWAAQTLGEDRADGRVWNL